MSLNLLCQKIPHKKSALKADFFIFKINLMPETQISNPLVGQLFG